MGGGGDRGEDGDIKSGSTRTPLAINAHHARSLVTMQQCIVGPRHVVGYRGHKCSVHKN